MQQISPPPKLNSLKGTTAACQRKQPGFYDLPYWGIITFMTCPTKVLHVTLKLTQFPSYKTESLNKIRKVTVALDSCLRCFITHCYYCISVACHKCTHLIIQCLVHILLSTGHTMTAQWYFFLLHTLYFIGCGAYQHMVARWLHHLVFQRFLVSNERGGNKNDPHCAEGYKGKGAQPQISYCRGVRPWANECFIMLLVDKTPNMKRWC